MVIGTLPELPVGVTRVFVVIVVLVAAGMVAAIYGHALRIGFPRSGSRRLAFDVSAAILGWLALTGILARSGVFLNFGALPPRIVFAIVPSLALAATIFLSRSMREFFNQMPLAWLIGLQTFRLPLELVLHQLWEAGAVPRIMTFEGRNFDIIIGATAPVVAVLVAQRKEWAYKLALWWNFAGLVLLANVVGHGFLAAPTRWQMFTEPPANTFIARFPYVWLVTLLVPLAALLHCLALRALAAQRSVAGLASSPRGVARS